LFCHSIVIYNDKEPQATTSGHKTLGNNRLYKLLFSHQSSLCLDSDIAPRPPTFHTAIRRTHNTKKPRTMRKLNYILTLTVCALLLTSCESRQNEELSNQYEKELISSLNNPDSYEFVDFKMTDTIYKGDLLNKRFGQIKLEIAEQELKLQKSKLKMSNASTQQLIESWSKVAESRIKVIEAIEKEKDSLISEYKKTKDIPHRYIGTHTFRNVNGLNAKIKQESKIAFDDKMIFVERLPADFNLNELLKN
jgi:hypothetical protein